MVVTGYLSVILAYLLGSIPFGYLAGRLLRREDIRDYGSGNIGATNVMRLLGPATALLVLALDVGKGAAAVLLARSLTGQEYFWWMAALAVLVGHCWPLFLGFKGGKGTATGLGILLVLVKAPIWGIILILAGIVIALTRYVSLVSITAAVSFPILLWLFRYAPAYICFGVVIGALVVVRHQANIRRLINGTESRLGQKVGILRNKGGGSSE
ncbi:MAG: glycerol-3-phosphate 1-O-acyltransferase PlsY [Firmicutes bacterium]|nr:glycerol-3-phosphate 1-O-acyltransferase PlsY [Bacillota bacterium]